ncbi:MAG: glycosyltransferase family 1 protein [Verrucomicrobiae bacterium]|nr:glycosyltransferase family 1 protein [Verrucomicrobiae bacterium]
MKKMLFFRDFQAFSGGHLKVWHYFNHVNHSSNWKPYIYFTPNSIWNETNPWQESRENLIESLDQIKPDALFLAGLDWEILDQLSFTLKNSLPIVNLIQHTRHSHLSDPRFRFLNRKAIRICVSPEVKEVIESTQIIQGPCFTIPNGLDFDQLPQPLPSEKKDISLCIAALKQAPLGIRLKKKLEKNFPTIELLTQPLKREMFLNYLNRSQITLFLPTQEEGFYLPALEGMKLQTLVICPDCVGNRSFCHDTKNCFSPPYQEEILESCTLQACNLTLEQKNKMLSHATATAAQYGLAKEREVFLNILNQIPQLWSQL